MEFHVYCVRKGCTGVMKYTFKKIIGVLHTFKKIIGVLLTCVMLAAPLSALAEFGGLGALFASSADDFTVVDGVLTGWSGNDANLVIPADLGITAIGDNAFSTCFAIESVTIPEGVVSIGNSAFYFCKVLRNVDIPGSVVSIGDNAFFGCPLLENVSLPEGVVSIGQNAFCNCTALVNVDIPDTVTTIGNGAFNNCAALASVSLPAGIESIGTDAFRNCGALASVTFEPADPENIEAAAKTVEIGDYAFGYCTALENIVLPDNVVSIGEGAFRDCGKLAEINIPDGVLAIGSSAFGGCISIANVIIPDNVAEFGTDIFEWDTSILVYKDSPAQAYVQTSGNAYTILSKHAVKLVSYKQTQLSDGTAKVTFTIEALDTCDYILMYSENGELVRVFENGMEGVSYVSEGYKRIWTIEYSFNNDGEREISFCGSPDKNELGELNAYSLNVIGLKMHEAAFNAESVAAGSNAAATVKTDAGAKYLRMYAENGSEVYTWEAEGNSKVQGHSRVWTVNYTFNGTGSRTMTFRTSYDGERFIEAGEVTASIDVVVPVVTMNSAGFDEDIVSQNANVGITVKTSPEARYLIMYGENDKKVEAWGADGNSSVENGMRVWKVGYAFSGAGNRIMTFKASWDEKTLSEGLSDSIIVLTGNEAPPAVKSVEFSADRVLLGENVGITVKTPVHCYFIAMYSGDSQVKKWYAADSSTVSGKTRIWELTYAFSGAGNRSIYFKSSVNGSVWSEGKNSGILVAQPAYDVKSVEADNYSLVAKRDEVTISVVTTAETKYLHMFDKAGNTIKKWNADEYSEENRGWRYWTVTYTFSSSGNRSMTFKGSADSKVPGKGITVNFNVTNE